MKIRKELIVKKSDRGYLFNATPKTMQQGIKSSEMVLKKAYSGRAKKYKMK